MGTESSWDGLTGFVRKVVEPVARRASSAIVMRLVGYAVIRQVVGFDGLQRPPWGMSQTAVYNAERALRRALGMTSAEFVEQLLREVGAVTPEGAGDPEE